MHYEQRSGFGDGAKESAHSDSAEPEHTGGFSGATCDSADEESRISSGTVWFSRLTGSGMKYWETIANRLMKAGWSLSWLSAD